MRHVAGAINTLPIVVNIIANISTKEAAADGSDHKPDIDVYCLDDEISQTYPQEEIPAAHGTCCASTRLMVA